MNIELFKEYLNVSFKAEGFYFNREENEITFDDNKPNVRSTNLIFSQTAG